MTDRVVITGVGLVSPLGDRPDQLHEALCAGRSALGQPSLRQPDLFATQQIPNVEAAELPAFDARDYIEGNLRPLDRSSILACSAATLALRDADHDPRADGALPTGLVLGTMFGSIHTISEFDRRALTAGPSYAKPLVFANTVINAAAGQTAIRLGLNGVNATISGGSVSGLQALGYAADLIKSGRNQRVLAGGCEELSFEAMLGFRRAGRLAGATDASPCAVPFGDGRNGFSLGEGAALLALETANTATARGAAIHGSVLGFGQTFDPSRGRDSTSASGAMTRAITAALEDAGLDIAQIGCVFASANGSSGGDLHEGLALVRSLAGHRPPVTAIKSMLGESLGCSAALQAVAALEALRRGEVAGIHRLERPEPTLETLDLSALVRSPLGPVALITAQGFDGAAAALVLSGEDH